MKGIAAKSISPGIIAEAMQMRAKAKLPKTYVIHYYESAGCVLIMASCRDDEVELGYIEGRHEKVPGTAKWRLVGENWPVEVAELPSRLPGGAGSQYSIDDEG